MSYFEIHNNRYSIDFELNIIKIYSELISQSFVWTFRKSTKASFLLLYTFLKKIKLSTQVQLIDPDKSQL